MICLYPCNTVANEEIEEKFNWMHFDLSTVPDERKQQASGAITDFFNSIEYAPNIVRVQVNEVVILDKRPEIQSLAGKKI